MEVYVMFIKKLLVLLQKLSFKIMFVFVLTAMVISPVAAQENQPAGDEPDEGETVEVVSELVVVSTQKGIRTPDGLIGGPGGQSANLTSILKGTYGLFNSVQVKGKAKVQANGGPLAKAWTSLLKGGIQQETTSAYPCWTSSSNPCTSSTDDHIGYRGQFWQNVAETDVFWSSGGSTHGSATASKIW